MTRSILVLLVGAVLGAGSLWLLTQAEYQATQGVPTPAPALVRCEAELSQRVAEVEGLRKKVAVIAHTVAPQEQSAEDHEPAASGHTEGNNAAQASAWRISAIERFVPLSDEQRSRLQEKFAEERLAQEEGRESEAESLDDILEAENAQVYRDQVNAAFERVQKEELERDALWMARKLGLSTEQEGRMRAAFDEVERVVVSEFPPAQIGTIETPQKRVMRMIAENKRRVQLRAERLRQVLLPAQYEAYVKAESESSASDMEVFHGSGEEEQPGASASPLPQ
jgi:hypothetical protein